MKSPSFAELYSYDEAWIPSSLPDDTPPEVAVGEMYARQHGMLLHDMLSGKRLEIDPKKLFVDYYRWIAEEWQPLRAEIKAYDYDVDAQNAMRIVIGFHKRNEPMRSLWSFPGSDNSDETSIRRNNFTSISMQNIALYSVESIVERARRASIENRLRYLSDDDEVEQVYRSMVEGDLAEADGALALINASRQKRFPFDIVAAPPQFERGSGGNKGRNVDYIAVGRGDAAGHSIGVQVKARATLEDMETYQGDHCVLLCAATDLGDTAHRRTNMASSYLAHVSWAGSLAVSVLDQIKTVGRGKKNAGSDDFIRKYFATLPPYQQKHILTLIAKAKSVERCDPNGLARASNIVGDRIMHKLIV